jgi:hypothetical protein
LARGQVYHGKESAFSLPWQQNPGVDAIGLVQRMDRCTFPEAMQKLADHYRIWVAAGNPAAPKSSPVTRNGTYKESPEKREPLRADSVRQGLERRGYRVAAEYKYGTDLRKVRFEHKSKRQENKQRAEKTFRWEHRADDVWYSGDGDVPKPLYVNEVFRKRDQVGLAVGFEGEAKADVAGELGLTVFSFKDITPEQAATILWPDNDDSGRNQAGVAAQIITDAGQTRSVKTLVPLSEFPPAGDIVDAVKEFGWDGQRILQFVETAVTYSEPAPKSSSVPPEVPSAPAIEKPGYFPSRCMTTPSGSSKRTRMVPRCRSGWLPGWI